MARLLHDPDSESTIQFSAGPGRKPQSLSMTRVGEIGSEVQRAEVQKAEVQSNTTEVSTRGPNTGEYESQQEMRLCEHACVPKLYRNAFKSREYIHCE